MTEKPLNGEAKVLEARIASRLEETTTQITQNINRIVWVMVITVAGAIFWAGQIHTHVANMDKNLEWLIKTKIPEMDKERGLNSASRAKALELERRTRDLERGHQAIRESMAKDHGRGSP